MKNAEQTQAAMRALGPLLRGTKEERDAERARRREKTTAIQQEFREYLEANYAGDLPHSVYDLLYAKAWEEGHSSGWHSIEQCYEDYSIFARQILGAE